MKSRQLVYSALLLLAFMPINAKAQMLKRVIDMFPIELSNEWRLLPAPSLSYRPETNWSLGVSLTATHSQAFATKPQLSVIQLDVIYSLNQQFIADVDYQWRSRNGNWIFQGSDSWSVYPDLYFSQEVPNLSESISFKRLELDNKLYRKIRHEVFAGLRYHLQWISEVSSPSSGLFENEDPIGSAGGLSAGLGIGVLRDLRNNPLSPSAGESLIRLEAVTYQPGLASDFTFTTWEADLRYYLRLSPNLLLAWQGIGKKILGNAPFRMLGQLGGSDILRGYHARQFTGSSLYASQAELRLGLLPRVGIVLFGGLGSVANDKEQMEHLTIHAAGGTGIRIMIDQIDRNNIRIDVAYGETGLAWYFSYGEAF